MVPALFKPQNAVVFYGAFHRVPASSVFKKQIAYVGQGLHFPGVGIANTFNNPVYLHQYNYPAEAESCAQHLPRSCDCKKYEALAGMIKGKAIVSAEDERQKEQNP